MDVEFWRSLNRFLAQASEPELQRKLELTQAFIPVVRSDEVRRDASRIIRALELELAFRAVLRSSRS